ncbi:PIWI protein, partial [Acromyrmex heyeri]
MSKQERDRGYDDPYEPSTSSGHHRSKPYERKRSESDHYHRRGSLKVSIICNIVILNIIFKSSIFFCLIYIKNTLSPINFNTAYQKINNITIFVINFYQFIGKSGTSIMLSSNHFRLPTVPNWCVYQYRVDFEPEENRTFIRKGMLKLHKDKVGPYIFDGTILFSSTRLPDKIELTSVRKSDNTPFKVIIYLVGRMMPEDPHYITIFNIIMRKQLEHLNLQLVGRDYYDAHNKVSVHQFRLELWPGYITSIRQHERDILLNAEITHKVMRQETLYHVLMDCYRHSNNYRVSKYVDFETNPSSTFPMKDGQHISYQEYYKTKYKINISSASQPMLVTRTKPKTRNAGQGDLVYLVPELCRATDKNLLEFPGRLLNSERLLFADNRYINSSNGDWTRDMQKTRMLKSTALRHWIVLVTERDMHVVHKFIETLLFVSHGIAFRVDQPRIQTIRDDKAGTYAENLEYILSKSAPDLVFCVVSNNRSDRYAAIKKKCCLDRPVPSQVFLQKNLSGRNTMTIATKVAIQMNCKLGGAPWTIENPLKGLMVIGFDICHDTNTKGKDFLTMVATVDQTLTQYFSSIALFHSNEDLGDQLCASVRKAIMAYKERNKAFPIHLVIYRDGVSEGQLRQVYENEVQKLEKALETLYYGPNFKLIFIIVTKKINVRLFDMRGRNANPRTGTIVDDIITNPLRYDFFIVSQQVRQGTISPTSYNVIFDNTGLEVDVVQVVTYKLTHMYYNCSTTVRVPAPCHYAHKLSFLVGRFLHQPPNSQLEKQLFFL